MATVAEADLYDALLGTMMTADETVDTTKYTKVGSPTFEASATAIPGTSRSEKFEDYNDSGDYYTFDGTSEINANSIIISFRMKPDFTQTYGTDAAIVDTIKPGATDGFAFNFSQGVDDWRFTLRQGSTGIFNLDTVGETWSADQVIHGVILLERTAGLDGSKSATLYLDNVLVSSTTSTWNADLPLATSSVVGQNRVENLARPWDGGIYDLAFFDYSALSGSYTDAEIVQALYSNTYDEGGHKFNYELTGGSPPAATFRPRIMFL